MFNILTKHNCGTPHYQGSNLSQCILCSSNLNIQFVWGGSYVYVIPVLHLVARFVCTGLINQFLNAPLNALKEKKKRKNHTQSRTLRYESLCFLFKAIFIVSLPVLVLILLRQLTFFIYIWLLPIAQYGCQMVLAGIGQIDCLRMECTHACLYHNLKLLPVPSGTNDSRQGKDKTGKTCKNQERLKSSAQLEVTLIYGIRSD